MPWAETVTMQRLGFIGACQAGTDSLLPSAGFSTSALNRLQVSPPR